MGNLFHLLRQSAVLGGATLAVLGLLTLIGAWCVWWFYPRTAALRWPIHAPITGVAIVTVIGLPLACLGMPVTGFALPLASIGSALTLASFARLLTRTTGRRLLFTWLRCRSVAAVGVIAVIVALSTWLMTAAAKSDVRDAWGSGDFAAYWVVSDYLQNHGASIDSYQAQTQFHARDIEHHLTRHARLGSMVFLAQFGALLSPSNVHHLIAPTIVAAMVLLVGLAHYWLELERPGLGALLLLVLLHPFLFFLLYFSYASQASAVILFVAALLVPAHGLSSAMITGALTGAAILHHPAILPAAAIFWILRTFAVVPEARVVTAVGLLSLALTCGWYAGRTLTELVEVSQALSLPGWEWKGPIGSLEFIGVRTVLGWSLPEPRPRWVLTVDLIVMTALALLLWLGLRRTRLPAAAWSLVLATVGTTAIGWLKHHQGVPHATHAMVKTLSLFAMLIMLLALLPLGRWLATRPAWLAAGLALLAGAQCCAILRSPLQEPALKDDLIRLTRRVLVSSPEAGVQFPISMNPDFIAPVVRDSRRVIALDGATTAVGFRILSQREFPRRSLDQLDHEGDYYVLPVSFPYPSRVH